MANNSLKKIVILIVFIITILVSTLSLIACVNAGNDDLHTPSFPPYTDTPTNPENNGNTTSIIITINGISFYANLYDNATVNAFCDMLPMTLNMNAMPHEKFYNFSQNLVTNAYVPSRIQEGDIMLWGSNCLVLFYESFSTSYSYTRIGRIENTSGLVAAVGSGSVVICFSSEVVI